MTTTEEAPDILPETGQGREIEATRQGQGQGHVIGSCLEDILDLRIKDDQGREIKVEAVAADLTEKLHVEGHPMEGQGQELLQATADQGQGHVLHHQEVHEGRELRPKGHAVPSQTAEISRVLL